MPNDPAGRFIVETSPSERLIAEAADWLALHCHEVLGAEMLLRGRAERAIGGVHIARRNGAILGVSVFGRSGGWYLEARDANIAVEMVGAVPADQVPRRLVTAAGVREWVLPAVQQRFAIVRHHRLLAMTCTRVEIGEGRFADERDLPMLEQYQSAYNDERRTANSTNWLDAVAHRQVAVLDVDGRIASVVKRSGETSRYACIGGTYTFREFRGRGYGRKVTAFLAERLLEDRPRVHLIVDDDNAPAIALYRALDFGEIGECHFDYLDAASKS